MMYIKNTPQEDKILKYLERSEWRWVSAHDIVLDLWILQYSARIYGLRKKWYNIENKLEMIKKKDWETYKMWFFRLITN